MRWNDHSKDIPEGAHAFLSPSKYHWMNYSDEKLMMVFKKHLATQKGTFLHSFACMCIELRQKLPRSNKTLNMYVNDAIGFGMAPEQGLKYSENCFGRADAISFNKKYLRIHDLKTGEEKSSLHQLEAYAALFCLEYGYSPNELSGIELRIYQNDDIFIGNPEPELIENVMDTIIRFDKLIEDCKEESYGFQQ